MIAKLKRFNWLLLLAMLALVAVGTLAIHSAGNARAEAVFHTMWRSNLVTAGIGLVLFFALAFTDYRRYLDLAAAPFYALTIALLVIVLFCGSTVYGGRRWLWFFQPSEIAKLAVIGLLAWLLGDPESPAAGIRPRLWGFLTAALLVGLPCALILAEPDLGTTLTLVPAVLLMLFAAGVWRKGLIVLTVTGLTLALLVLGAVYEAERPGVPEARRAAIRRCLPLKNHQIRRVRVFLFPEEDLTGSGYNLRQAKISIGSGGLTGKGLGHGETNHLKYLPQAISMNDFIFCVWAEEMGYVGSLLLLLLYAGILLPGCWIAFASPDDRGRLLALGVTTLLFAHVYINIAMSIGLVPITGLPLPFVSSGRTFLVTVMCALGLVESVAVHRTTEADEDADDDGEEN